MRTSVSLRVLGFISAVWGGVFALLGLCLSVGLIGAMIYLSLVAHRLPPGGIPRDVPPLILVGVFLFVPAAVIFVAGVNLLREKASGYRIGLGAAALAAGCAIAIPVTFYILAQTLPAFRIETGSDPAAIVLGEIYLVYAAIAGLLLFLGRPRKRSEADRGARA